MARRGLSRSSKRWKACIPFLKTKAPSRGSRGPSPPLRKRRASARLACRPRTICRSRWDQPRLAAASMRSAGA
eukprot:11431309-Alexandrium_andersonii.AAC.1